MSILSWNHGKVRNLTPWEIWAFIAGRVLVGFGLGALAMQYYPQMFGSLAVPSLGFGIVLLMFAMKGLLRRMPNQKQQ